MGLLIGAAEGRYARAIFLDTDALEASTIQFQKSLLLLRLRFRHRQEILSELQGCWIIQSCVAMRMP